MAVIEMDLRGVIRACSDGVTHMFGAAVKALEGTDFYGLLLNVEETEFERERQAANAGQAVERERWLQRVDGSRLWTRVTLKAAQHDGHINGYVAVVRDLGARQAELEHLRQSHSEIRELLALRTRERDLIWNNSLDLLVAVDRGGFLRAANSAWQTILGFSEEEVVGAHFSAFVIPEDLEKCGKAIYAASYAPVFSVELRLRHRSAGHRVILWNGSPGGHHVFSSGRDVTQERQQQARRNQTSETRLRLALEAGGMGAWEWDLKSDDVTLIQGSQFLLGQPSTAARVEVASLRELSSRVHREDRTALTDLFARARKSRPGEPQKYRAEYRMKRTDGGLQWVEACMAVEFDEYGAPYCLLGISVDITRRKRNEEELTFLSRASTELSSLIDPQTTLDKLAALAVPHFADWCAIDLFSEETGELNRVAVSLIDLSNSDVAASYVRCYSTERNQTLGAWKVFTTGQPELFRDAADEDLFSALSNQSDRACWQQLGLRSYIGVPLVAHGRILGVASFVQARYGRLYEQADLDLAAELARRAAIAIENARLYRALQESDHGKDVFLATLAHELRNPLAAISNALGILQLASSDVRRVQHAAAIMDRQIKQLGRLVEDLMDVSRIATGKISLRLEDCDLVVVLTNAIEMTRSQIEAAHHQLSVSLPNHPIRVRADPIRLTQVFANLINNAVKYTDDGGHIAVEIEALGDELAVRVRDDGIGMHPDLMKGIFSIFRQGTHPLDRSHGGLGIGLSLVEGLVRMHGGRITVSSEGEGHGSEFIVYLPFTEIAHTHKIEAVLSEAAPRKRRVLVVDDNVDAANTVAELLRLMDHEVWVEHDGLAAVDKALQIKPDIALLDIGLPGLDGYEVARKIRAEEAGGAMVLVALTGWGQARDQERAFEAGFDHHCVKPIDLNNLKRLLQ